MLTKKQLENISNIVKTVIKDLNLTEALNEVNRAWVSENGSKILRVSEGLTHSDYAGLITGEERTTNLSEFENTIRKERAEKRKVGNGDDYNENRMIWMRDAMAEGWMRVGCFPVATSDTTYVEVHRLTETQLKTAQNFLKTHPEYHRSVVIVEQLQPRTNREARITKKMSDFLTLSRFKPEDTDIF